jgi:hypothetical protein
MCDSELMTQRAVTQQNSSKFTKYIEWNTKRTVGTELCHMVGVKSLKPIGRNVLTPVRDVFPSKTVAIMLITAISDLTTLQ